MPDQSDIQLIAETIGEKWCYPKCCCCVGGNLGKTESGIGDGAECPVCHGACHNPHIDDTNILRVIFRWAKHQSWWLVERDEAGSVQSNIETMFSDICTDPIDWHETSFVDYSVRIIAGAIREQREGE